MSHCPIQVAIEQLVFQCQLNIRMTSRISDEYGYPGYTFKDFDLINLLQGPNIGRF